MPRGVAIKRFKETVVSLEPYEKLSLLISSVGLFVGILGLLSLIFIYWQTHQTYESLTVSAHQSITTQELDLDRIFVEHPGLRPYFYRGADINEIEDKEKYEQVMAVAEYELDFFDSVKSQLRHMPYDQGTEFWDNYIEASFKNSPALCKRLKENSDWYEKDLVAVADKACSQERK